MKPLFIVLSLGATVVIRKTHTDKQHNHIYPSFIQLVPFHMVLCSKCRFDGGLIGPDQARLESLVVWIWLHACGCYRASSRGIKPTTHH